jgi:hypothetical protein
MNGEMYGYGAYLLNFTRLGHTVHKTGSVAIYRFG